MTTAQSRSHRSVLQSARAWVVDLVRRPFAKRGGASRADTPATRDVGAFIAERRANMAHLSEEDIDKISDEALSQVDAEQTLREVEALRERMKVQPDTSARTLPD
jgi:hypothetical protein